LFQSLAVDSLGNIFAAGYIAGSGSYDFGGGVTAQGASSHENVVLVRYNASGAAQWARTVSTGSSSSIYYSVTVDASDNICAAGYIAGTESYGFGNGASAQGPYSDRNAVLVKYNSSGTTQWAQTVAFGTSTSWFQCAAADTSGNVYAAGCMWGTGSYGFGNSVSAQGVCSTNVVLVKYDSSGAAQWARTASTGYPGSNFNSVAVDSLGSIYAAGAILGTGVYTFGAGTAAQGVSSSNNVVLVKYSSSGAAQWAQTIVSGSGGCSVNSVAVDASDNIYAAGDISGTGSYDFGNGVGASGPYSGGSNVLLVKY
jgi:hypothetical protein